MMMLGSKDVLRIVPYFVSSYSLRSVLNVCHWHTAPWHHKKSSAGRIPNFSVSAHGGFCFMIGKAPTSAEDPGSPVLSWLPAAPHSTRRACTVQREAGCSLCRCSASLHTPHLVLYHRKAGVPDRCTDSETPPFHPFP